MMYPPHFLLILQIDSIGLPVCIEMCIRALQMESCDGNTKATICKTISCLLPNDLEVKRACQLTEFLLEPTVDSYYAVETLYNEPDQKLEEENMPVPNSLRCDLLLVFKTQWPFDPEFWDWKTLKRQCLALMGEEASIVSSIDLLNDCESPEAPEDEVNPDQEEFRDVTDCFVNTTNELREITDKRQKNREVKKLREKGFISARFRNWQAYMQYCVLCDKEFLGHRIVRHAQTHLKGGVYSCPICTETFTSKDTLVPHVASHVKQSCKERLTAIKTNNKLANPKTAAPVIAALKAKPENQLYTKENSDYQDHNGGLTEAVQTKVSGFNLGNSVENVCPVTNCRKGFKFLKNLLTHVKAHGDNEEAKRYLDMQNKKVVCQYCRRQFVNVTHLNDHLQVHCGVKPYICIQLNCKASFLSNPELIVHRKEHPVFKARCMFPNCGKIFNEAFKLYDHEAQHYNTFTCKIPDCGKVFHSQTKLDFHQEEHFTEEVESPAESATEEQTSQDAELAPSLIEQMLSDQTTLSHEFSLDSESCIDENAPQPDCVRVTHCIESLPTSSQEPVHNLQTLEQYAVKSEPPDRNVFPICQYSDNSVIQSMNSHFPDPNQLSNPSAGSDASFDFFSPAPHNQVMSPFEATVGEFSHARRTNVLQGQAQMFPNNGNVGSMRYNSDCNLSIPEQLQAMCVNNLLPAGSPQDNMPPAMSQPLPPAVALLPPSANRLENNMAYPSTSALPTGEKERHHCALETCTRNYSSYRSVTKHMKAAHPEFYNQWKLAKRNNKPPRATPLSVPSVGNCTPVASLQNRQGNGVLMHRAQKQNVIQPSPYTNMGPSSSYPTLSSHSSIQGQNAPIHMENILSPIVLSQLGSTSNPLTSVQSQVAPSQQWHSTPGNEQIPNCGSSQVYPSNIQGMRQMDATSGALGLGIPSHHMMGSNRGSTAESLQPTPMENAPQPVLPSYMDSVKGPSHQMGNSLPPYTSQMQRSSVSNTSAQEMAKKTQNHVQSKFLSSNGACQASSNYSSQNDKAISGNGTEVPKRKRNKRTKWPAIIRDGKFICCRCFREFESPKSLGGHLSKRSHCKAYDETELSAALPTSFLDLLNSEQTVNALQPPSSYDPSVVYQEKPCKSVPHGSTDPKDFPTSNYPQANLPSYGNGDSNDDLLQQIIASSNISELFEQPAVPQPTFQNPCGPYGAGECLPESSVIQHTGNIRVKREDESCMVHYPQASLATFGTNDFSDPLLSQILSENLPAAPLGNPPTDQVSSEGILNDGHLSAMASLTPNISNPMKQSLSPDPQHSPASTSGKQAGTQRKWFEQDIRKRLREQILASDFQRRNSSSHSGNTDSNGSLKSPMSLSPTPSISKPSLLQVIQYSKNIDTTSGGQVEETNSGITPAFSAQIQGAVNMQNFTGFKEASTQRHEMLTPTSIVANDVDLGPTQSPANQHLMMEIQTAFENLNLDREISDPTSSSMKPISTDVHHETELAKIDSQNSSLSNFVKPFACDGENCTFRAMSNEALVKHLTKCHNYTLEMIHSLRKKTGKIAPYCCQKCSKTFTRNSNLRAHYHSAHRLSPEEIADLDIKRKLARTFVSVNNQNQLSGGGNPAPKTQTAAIASHSPMKKGTHPYSLQNMIKQEYPSPPFGQQPNTDAMNQGSHGDNFSMGNNPLQRTQMHNQALNPTATMSVHQALTMQPLQAAPDAERWSDGQHTPVATVSTQYLPGQHAGDLLLTVSTPVTQPPSGLLQVGMPQSLEKQSNINTHRMVQPKFEKPNMDVPKKMKEKKPDSNDAFSPYRPYRCVHQGCVAAFTIQHNLILHYRAVHQSALLEFEENQEHDEREDVDDSKAQEDEEPESEVNQVFEFRCMEKDCCRVFSEVPSLLQHYLQLHEFSLDKAGTLMSNINLGRFACDQPGCTASFTAFWKYIGHVKKEHENLKLSKSEPATVMFKCDVEDCDRAYATKSNLLRHTMKKHNEIYLLKQTNQEIGEEDTKQNSKNSHYQITKSSNGKENIEGNKKIQQKEMDKRKTDRAKPQHWTKYGKPSLKAKEEASAMCTKRYTLQYPCMIKSCETVMRSERSIMKHYIGHGLSEKYLEEQRSHFIFCKKLSRQKSRSIRSDDSRSENTSDLSEAEFTADIGLSEYEYTKPVLRKRVTTTQDPELFDSKLSNDESSEAVSECSIVVRRKRGRPRKLIDKIVKRKRVPRSTKSKVDYHGDDGSDSSSSPALPLDEPSAPINSFKPMGFEMSFLKFLEQSNQSEHSLQRKIQLSTMLRKTSDAYLHAKDSCVEFSNPQKLQSLNNVKIIVDGAYSDVFDLLLKQLQEMRPMVILEKNYSV